MDILTILKTEHDLIRAGFTKLESCDGVKNHRAMVEDLGRTLQIQLTLQKDYLYPEIAGLFFGAENLVDVGLANGATIARRLKAVLKEAAKPLVARAAFEKKVAELREGVLKHFEAEEQLLMPKVRGLIRTEEREDIGQLYLDMKEDVTRVLATPPGPAAGRKRA
jgi:hypothetical protein